MHLWGCGRRGSVVHKSTGGWMAQINAADTLETVVDVRQAIGVGLAYGDRLPGEGFADAPSPIFVTENTISGHPANCVARPILDLRQCLGKCTLADTVTAVRSGEIERVVRAQMVVDVTPAIERILAM